MFRSVILLIAVLAPSVLAQDESMLLMLDPRVGQAEVVADYEFEHHFSTGVGDQNSDLGFTDHDLRLRVPVMQDEQRELTVGTRIKVLDFDTEAWFPDTSTLLKRDHFPDHLWDIRLNTTYRQKLQNDSLIGGTLSIGSPSDRPFASLEEMAVNATGFLRIPDGDNNAWVFFLNYANNREFLRHVPIPGVGYEIKQNDDFFALLGLPLTSARWAPVDKVELDGFYFIPRTVRARISYLPAETVRLYAAYEWLNQRFFRHNREDDDDRLFYYEQRVKGGIRWDITDWLYVDVNGGYSFDRFIFEGEKFDDRGDNRMNLGDGPFVAARLVLSFE